MSQGLNASSYWSCYCRTLGFQKMVFLVLCFTADEWTDLLTDNIPGGPAKLRPTLLVTFECAGKIQ